jgi:hypothetical protein
MKRRIASAGATSALAILLVGLLAPAAAAHEGRKLGDLEMVAGFGTEPAYVGQPNSVQLLLVHDGKPVVDLGDTLDIEVGFGDQTMQLELEPFFEEGEFGTPGDYRAWFIPTAAGEYSFHFSGTIDGEEVDETFTSGPDTFSDVVSTDDIEFPENVPSNGELAERIDRESGRTSDSIDQAAAQADQAAEAAGQAVESASRAADDASSARTLGTIGLVVGALGLIVAIVAIVLSRRKTA